jgi:hypothetical protein
VVVLDLQMVKYIWLVDVSIQNAWILHRAGGSTMPQLDFRRQIAARYCSSLGKSTVAKNYRRPKTAMESFPRFVPEINGAAVPELSARQYAHSKKINFAPIQI